MGEVTVDHSEKSPKSDVCSKSDVVRRMTEKKNNVAEINIEGIKTFEWTDSVSQINSISEFFYQSLDHNKAMHDINELGLSVTSASGSQLPVQGYYEVK